LKTDFVFSDESDKSTQIKMRKPARSKGESTTRPTSCGLPQRNLPILLFESSAKINKAELGYDILIFPNARSLYFMNNNAVLRERVVTIALKEDGTLAIAGSRTWGQRIGEYLETVGLDQGHDYCVAFIYWCFKNASEQLGQKNPMPKTGRVKKLCELAEQYGLFITAPERGDIYVTHAKDHAGILELTPTDLSKARTIEGNTWIGDRKWGVHRRRKNLSNDLFIRL
jgi:hypothetical protein